MASLSPRVTLLVACILSSFFSTAHTDFNNESISPMCYIETVDENIPCPIFDRPIDSSYVVTNMEINQSLPTTVRLLSGQTYTYVNATRPNQMDKGFRLVVASRRENGERSTWEVEAPAETGTLHLAYIPVTNHPIEAFIIRQDIIDIAPIDKMDEEAKCQVLINADLVMKAIPATKTLEIVIITSELGALSVELLGAECNITCQNGTSDCDVNTTGYEMTKLPKKLELIIYNLSLPYYCARFVLGNCGLICSETIHLPKVAADSGNNLVTVRGYWGIYVALCAAAATFSVALCAIIYVKERRENRVHLSLEAHAADQEGLIQMNKLEAEGQLFEDNSQVHSTEVLLLYTKESKEFSIAMEAFRNILKSYGIKVWDPFDESCIESVSANPNAWIGEKLRREEIRVILLETASGVARQKALISGTDEPLIQHYLDGAFIYALSCLHQNPRLCQNYKRLFVIRFGTPLTEQYTSTVSFTRYQIPDNIASLLKDIIGREYSRSGPVLTQKLINTNEFQTCINEYVNKSN